MASIRRALLSCYDKTGLEGFAAQLAQRGVELIASGGTEKFLTRRGLRVRSVESFTGAGELLNGRVKTLHPRIHAGILARRDDPAHVRSVGEDGLIDLVVVNLYPFEETVRRSGATLAEAVEQIDIGGVALLRSAAKNFASVTVVSDASQYAELDEALAAHGGAAPEPLRRRLAVEAFRLTGRYDRLIEAYLAGADAASTDGLPDALALETRKAQSLRYGENPAQQAAWYAPAAGPTDQIADVRLLQGKPLSYNNLLDLDAALGCLADLDAPARAACVIVKHASPCGAAMAVGALEAYQRALAGDAESAFGGIVAVDRPIDAGVAAALTATFLEVVAAPSVRDDAKAVLACKPNLRVLELASWPSPSRRWRSALGGWLVQDEDLEARPAPQKAATVRQPSPAQWADLAIAWVVAKHVKSNAIVIAKDGATVGIGQGQPSRVRAVRLAVQNAGEKARGAVLASDGFFPFPDNVEAAAQAGIAAIIQPGGSIKDGEVLAAAERAGLAMVMTGVRHFRH